MDKSVLGALSHTSSLPISDPQQAPRHKPKNCLPGEDPENWQQSDTAPRGPREEVRNCDRFSIDWMGEGGQPCLCKLRSVQGLPEIWGAETFMS